MESKRDCPPPPVLNVNNEYNCVTLPWLYTIAMGKVHFELSSNISKNYERSCNSEYQSYFLKCFIKTCLIVRWVYLHALRRCKMSAEYLICTSPSWPIFDQIFKFSFPYFCFLSQFCSNLGLHPCPTVWYWKPGLCHVRAYHWLQFSKLNGKKNTTKRHGNFFLE